MPEEITYKKAGVDIDKGDEFVRRISPLARSTFRPEVLTGLGSFGALFKLDMAKYREPVLVSGTDGVGTKLKVAFMLDRHDTIGIDLVAMCANDVLTLGAEPLFFLDYFATGALKTGTAVKVIEGIVKGCDMAGCALIGGETAEMPGFYKDDEYDVSGFCVGAVDRNDVVDGSTILQGDAVLGIASSGIHSNGYSLVRKIVFDHMKLKPDSPVDGLDSTIGDELIKPTHIYARAVLEVLKGVKIKGMAHITGGGLPGNLPRALPEGCYVEIKRGSWPVPEIFKLLKGWGNVPDNDMDRTFNMGIGYALVLDKQDVKKTVDILSLKGYDSYLIGEIKRGGTRGEEGLIYA